MLTCPKSCSGCILKTLYYPQRPFKSRLLNCSIFYISIFFQNLSKRFLFSGFLISLNILAQLSYRMTLSFSGSEVSAGPFLISVLLLSRAASWRARTYLHTTHYTISKLLTKAYQLGVMEHQLILSLQWFLIFNLQEIRASPMHMSVRLYDSVCKQTHHLFFNCLVE